MSKKSLGLAVLLTLALLVGDSSAEEEEFVITTYYPSPYGSYNELEVYRSVTYKPVNKDTITNPKEGELIYNGSDDTFYYYNGQTWTAQGGGGGYFLQCGNTCPAGTTRVGAATYGTGIGGVVAKGGYSSSTIIDDRDQWGTTHYVCICYCSSSLWAGGESVPCASAWDCGRKREVPYDLSQCNAYCQSAVPQMQVTGISICK